MINQEFVATTFFSPKPTIDTLVNRRSIRAYTPFQISDDDLYQILAAARFAPSAKNEQPCKFVVVRKKENMDRLIDETCKFTGRTSSSFYGAPTVIIVFAKEDCIAPIADGALALGNMMTAAYALNLGSCWINCVGDFFNKTEEGKKFREDMGIPEGYTCVGSVAIGNPDERPEPKPRVEDSVIMF